MSEEAKAKSAMRDEDKVKKAGKDAAEKAVEELPEPGALVMPDDMRYKLLYMQTCVESAAKDVAIQDAAIQQYQHDHNRKLANLKAELRARQAKAGTAKAQYVAYYAEVERELGIELKRCAVQDDGTITIVDEPEEDEEMKPASEAAPVPVTPPASTSTKGKEEPGDDGTLPTG